MAAAPPRLVLALAALWMLAFTWKLYPHFRDTIRVDGRLTTVASHLDDVCGQRVGPAAVTCLAETGEQAQLMLRQEQAKSVLTIVAPPFAVLALWWAAGSLRRRVRAART
ncbi:MAG TPA: hypothetical protein VN802_07290 [Stellaceae bacterium]|nr:hypothetical protein [Stellaceae bacterium]